MAKVVLRIDTPHRRGPAAPWTMKWYGAVRWQAKRWRGNSKSVPSATGAGAGVGAVNGFFVEGCTEAEME